MIDTKRYILAAKITKTHGLKGLLKVRVFLEQWPQMLKKLIDSKENKVPVSNTKLLNGRNKEYIIQIEGVDSLETAISWITKELFIDSLDLPSLCHEEKYYYHELLGLPIVNHKNEKLGEVVDIFNLNAGDIIEVKLNMDRIVNLPFESQIITEVKKGTGGYLTLSAIGESLLFI